MSSQPTRTAEAVFAFFGDTMLKPFKTIEEQIEILQSRGMQTDPDTASILIRENYYSVINGYKDLFLQKKDSDIERYIPGTKFHEVYDLFLFDRSLRMLSFKYLAIAESTLKTVSAYHFAMCINGNHSAYLEEDNYGKGDHYSSQKIENLIDEFKSILGLNPDKKPKRLKPYIEHYKNNYGEVPIWVLMNYLTIGQALQFFQYQKEYIKYQIAETFSTLYESNHDQKRRITHRDLNQAYSHIKDMRNICAHDERLYCARVSPGNNISFADMLNDLDLVLPIGDSEQLRLDVQTQIAAISNSLQTIKTKKIIDSLGFKAISDVLMAEG